MASLSDLFDFNKFVLSDLLDRVRDDPIRLLLGGITPLDTGIQNALLGRDDEPFLTQLGGATPETFERARQSGINTETGEQAQQVADVIAAVFGGMGLAQAGRGAFQSFQAGRTAGAGGSSGASGAGSSNPVQQGFDLSNIPGFGGGGGGGGSNVDAQRQLQELLERLRLQRQQELLRQQALLRRNALIMNDNPLFGALQ